MTAKPQIKLSASTSYPQSVINNESDLLAIVERCYKAFLHALSVERDYLRYNHVCAADAAVRVSQWHYWIKKLNLTNAEIDLITDLLVGAYKIDIVHHPHYDEPCIIYGGGADDDWDIYAGNRPNGYEFNLWLNQ